MDKYKTKNIEVNEETARNLRFNNYLEVIHGNSKFVASLVQLSINKLVFLLNEQDLKMTQEIRISCKLYFHLYRFILNGKIEKIEQIGIGTQKVHYTFGFSPELTEILDDYFYRIEHVEK